MNCSLPIAYFFITSITGKLRASIVKMAIEMLYKNKVYVCGLTFDGAASKINMASYLGCNFSISNLKPYFILNNKG